jgi:serine/threonine protein kinase
MTLPFQHRDFYGRPVRILGSGSYGTVTLTSKDFAIKDIATDEGFPTQSGLIEIVSLLKVVSPYVIPIVDVILTPARTSVVLPLADSSLSFVMNQPGLDVRSISRQLCLGLADIQNSNLLHLDLKPDNILLKGGNVWIADLGISEVHTCALPPIQKEVVTLWYRPPEILLDGDITEKADIWSLGVIITELILSQKRGEKIILFPGDSDRDELDKIFRLLGTPTSGSLLRMPGWRAGIPIWKKQSWSDLTPEEESFVEYILDPDPVTRPNIFQVLTHPWLQIDNPTPELTCYERLLVYAHYPDNLWEDFSRRQEIISHMANLADDNNYSGESLALGVYLLDRIAGVMDNLELYGLAALLIGTTFYNNYAPDYNDFEYSKVDLREAIEDILKITSFDLAVATSYFFLAKNWSLSELSLWRASLLTRSHFFPPNEVADAIRELAQGSEILTPLGQRLREEILALPQLYLSRPAQKLLVI